MRLRKMRYIRTFIGKWRSVIVEPIPEGVTKLANNYSYFYFSNLYKYLFLILRYEEVGIFRPNNFGSNIAVGSNVDYR